MAKFQHEVGSTRHRLVVNGNSGAWAGIEGPAVYATTTERTEDAFYVVVTSRGTRYPFTEADAVYRVERFAHVNDPDVNVSPERRSKPTVETICDHIRAACLKQEDVDAIQACIMGLAAEGELGNADPNEVRD